MVDTYLDNNLNIGMRQTQPIAQGGGYCSPRFANGAFTGGQANGDIIRFARVPSNSIPYAIDLANDALAGMTVNVGFYFPKLVKAGAAPSAGSPSVFSAGVSLATASPKTNLLSGLTPAQRGLRMWELAGLTRDPSVMFDLALTLTAAGTATGNIALFANIAMLN